MGSVEADDERQITVADDWQLQRLAHSSSTNIDLHYQLMFLTFITLKGSPAKTNELAETIHTRRVVYASYFR